MLNIDQFVIKKIFEENNEGVFILGPLMKGYGYTLTNSLRRILLSSLTGGAITAIKVDGVEHEYSTVPGVQDDMLKLLLKLKAVAIKCYSDVPVKALIEISSKKGESIDITAADIQVDASVEIINKDLLITTVSNGNKLRMEITIEKGVGFKIADSEKRSEIGVIPVDGCFSPVENVQVKISKARVGKDTNLDQVEIMIRTNGVLTPTESLIEAVTIFNKLTQRLVDQVQTDMSGEEPKSIEDDKPKQIESIGLPVKNLKLSTRLRNALMNSVINDLRLLDGKTTEELMEIRGMGEKSVDELVEIMKQNNLTVL